MIKLVTQFDNEKMRATVATPTCGPCCSCCCCCVVTMIATSIVTARNLGRIVEENAVKSKISAPQRNKQVSGATALGFLLVPICLLFLAVVPLPVELLPHPFHEYFAPNIIPFGFAKFFLVYFFMFLLLGIKYKIPFLYTITTVVSTVVLLIVEFYVWITFVFRAGI